jgi:hypothetical protein
VASWPAKAVAHESGNSVQPRLREHAGAAATAATTAAAAKARRYFSLIAG